VSTICRQSRIRATSATDADACSFAFPKDQGLGEDQGFGEDQGLGENPADANLEVLDMQANRESCKFGIDVPRLMCPD